MDDVSNYYSYFAIKGDFDPNYGSILHNRGVEFTLTFNLHKIFQKPSWNQVNSIRPLQLILSA